ncbi:MAG: tRNA lysidine(34) synthetase TilS [Anaerolineaceae bacterium]|jgi:tRNA(Ile)-lysidine synthase|nr:MAG: tRNA lysidine(34) synthetase TilS [Anaerolineaceae bacterium]
MLKNIETILLDECSLVKDRPIIVGVSGGPDSLCLMEVLRQAGYPLIAAYFDHQLRPDSGLDGRMVEKTATRLMLPCVIDGADVRGYAEERKISIEEAARNLRYRFMFDLARRQRAQAVAVGHTADDQVETILMHFLRGSGLAGLKGMSYRSIIKTFDPDIPIVRPLLDLWREETVIFCAVNGLRPHYDSSNDSLNFQRNRIRHLLIPSLETYNPKFREAILRMSQSLKGDHAFVMETLENAWRETVIGLDEEIVTFDAERLSDLSLGLQRNLVKHAMQTLRPGVDITFSILDRAVHLINSTTQSSRADLKASLTMFRESNRIYICTSDAELPFNLWPQMRADESSLTISIPKQVALAGGWKLTCERWRLPALAKEQAERNEDQFQVWLDADELPEQLELRVRRQGDHFSPLGMDGHSQKLSDFFVNEKVPQRAREHWPLLCAGDEIIWVPGYRPAHRHRLKDSTRSVVYFSMMRPLEKVSPNETPRP